jgi:hypothetical protein
VSESLGWNLVPTMHKVVLWESAMIHCIRGGQEKGDLMHANVYISDVEKHLGYEVIKIANQGNVKSTLEGWRIVTTNGFFVYKIPFNVIVKPGCQLHVACSSDALIHTKFDLMWRRQKGLNPNLDLILLIDVAGNVVDRFQYGKFGTQRIQAFLGDRLRFKEEHSLKSDSG